MDNDLLYLLTILAVLRNLKRHVYRSFHYFIPDRYTTEVPLDLPFAYRQSESRTPIVLLYTQEANMVEKLVIEGAQRKQVCKSFVCKNSWCQKCNDFFVCLCFKFSLLILDFMDFSLPICFSAGGVACSCSSKCWNWRRTCGKKDDPQGHGTGV